jgi:hypothetical protein
MSEINTPHQMTEKDIKPGMVFRDPFGTFKIMAIAEKWAMVRRRGAAPFCLSLKNILQWDLVTK